MSSSGLSVSDHNITDFSSRPGTPIKRITESPRKALTDLKVNDSPYRSTPGQLHRKTAPTFNIPSDDTSESRDFFKKPAVPIKKKSSKVPKPKERPSYFDDEPEYSSATNYANLMEPPHKEETVSTGILSLMHSMRNISFFPERYFNNVPVKRPPTPPRYCPSPPPLEPPPGPDIDSLLADVGSPTKPAQDDNQHETQSDAKVSGNSSIDDDFWDDIPPIEFSDDFPDSPPESDEEVDLFATSPTRRFEF